VWLLPHRKNPPPPRPPVGGGWGGGLPPTPPCPPFREGSSLVLPLPPTLGTVIVVVVMGVTTKFVNLQCSSDLVISWWLVVRSFVSRGQRKAWSDSIDSVSVRVESSTKRTEPVAKILDDVSGTLGSVDGFPLRKVDADHHHHGQCGVVMLCCLLCVRYYYLLRSWSSFSLLTSALSIARARWN
jgi:hypothetical protein